MTLQVSMSEQDVFSSGKLANSDINSLKRNSLLKNLMLNVSEADYFFTAGAQRQLYIHYTGTLYGQILT